MTHPPSSVGRLYIIYRKFQSMKQRRSAACSNEVRANVQDTIRPPPFAARQDGVAHKSLDNDVLPLDFYQKPLGRLGLRRPLDKELILPLGRLGLRRPPEKDLDKKDDGVERVSFSSWT